MGLATLWKKAKKAGKFLHNKAGKAVKWGRGAVNKVNGLMAKGNQILDNMGAVGKAIKVMGKTALNQEYKGVNPAKLWETVERGVEQGEKALSRADKIASGDYDEIRKISDELYNRYKNRNFRGYTQQNLRDLVHRNQRPVF